MQTYLSLSITAIVLAAMFAWNIQKRFRDGTYRFFVMTMLSVSAWSVFSILEVISASETMKVLWASLLYLSIVSMPLFWFFFTFEYTGNRAFLHRKKLWLLWLEPVLILLLVFTNPLHHLFWLEIVPGGQIDGFLLLEYRKGFFFLVHTLYSYVFISLGIIRIAIHLINHRLILKQIYVVIGLVAPFAANILYLTGTLPLDGSSAAFTLTCICFAWAIISTNMAERAQILEKLLVNEKLAGIGHLAAGIAHEINNPLGYAKSNLFTLEKYMVRLSGLVRLYEDLTDQRITMTEEEMTRRLEEITQYRKSSKITYLLEDFGPLARETHEGIARIERIVRSLLVYTGSASPNAPVELDLNECIREILPMLEYERALTIRIAMETRPIPFIHADRQDVGRILLNLTTNAIQSIKDKNGSGTISIRTGCLGAHVFCEVSDDGCGIDTANLRLIFDPFFTTRPIGAGTGLGLSVARELLVNKYHGDITVESQLGKGSTFRILFPLPESCPPEKWKP